LVPAGAQLLGFADLPDLSDGGAGASCAHLRPSLRDFIHRTTSSVSQRGLRALIMAAGRNCPRDRMDLKAPVLMRR
jgi:hypothetical protein